MSNLSVVVDTNVFVSAIVFGSKLNMTILKMWLDNRLTFCISEDLVAEILTKLVHFKQPVEVISLWKKHLNNKANFYTPTVEVSVCRDIKDNFLLELAKETNAEFLITRDKDLLSLVVSKWQNTKIIKPEDFIVYARKMNNKY